MTTPRHDEDKSRHESARQEDERNRAHAIEEARKRDPAVGDSERERLLVEKPFDFIQRTDPADRLGAGMGQQTRDNVNPAIPSAEPGTGGIVDPVSLGMPQASGGPEPRVEPPQAKETPPLPDAHPDMLAARLISPNEPWGSNVGGEATDPGGGTGEGGELVLTSIDPDRIPVQPEEITEKSIQVTGSGFTNECVVLFDDEEVTTTFVSPTRLDAMVPIAPAEGTYDVEVARGEELSDVLTFEIVAAEEGPNTRSAKREPQKPKPKKSEPPSKRNKKSKGRK